VKPTLEQLFAEFVAQVRDLREQLAKHAGDADGLISVEKAAQRLDVSESFVRKQIREKRLDAYRIGSCVRVRIADVDALAIRDGSERVDERDETRERVLRLARGERS
jgi:excisionase family DNA binding protein